MIVLGGRECFRVTRRGVLIHNDGRGYCYSLAELERVLAVYGVGLGDLVEDDEECELVAGSGHPLEMSYDS